jgi:hypothetical protein
MVAFLIGDVTSGSKRPLVDKINTPSNMIIEKTGVTSERSVLDKYHGLTISNGYAASGSRRPLVLEVDKPPLSF